MRPVIRDLPSGATFVLFGTEADAAPHLFDGPVALANARLPRLEGEPDPPEDAARAVAYFYETAPFLVTRRFPPAPAGVTPAFAEAYGTLAREGTRYTRGERGGYLVGVRTDGTTWEIAAITARPRTLCFRLEDFARFLPAALRAETADLEIRRDPNRRDGTDEPLVRETFAGVRSDARVMVDLAASGGVRLRLASARA